MSASGNAMNVLMKRPGYLLVAALAVLCTGCPPEPPEICIYDDIDLSVVLEKQYEQVLVQWQGELKEPAGEEEYHPFEACQHKKRIILKSKDMSPGPPPGEHVLLVENDPIKLGLWSFEVTVTGDGCSWTRTCNQQVGGENLVVAKILCESSSGLKGESYKTVPVTGTDFSRYPRGQQPCRWEERWNAENYRWVVEDGDGIGGVQLHGSRLGGGSAWRLLSWSDVRPWNDLRLTEPDSDTLQDVELLAKVFVENMERAEASLFARAAGEPGSESGYYIRLFRTIDSEVRARIYRLNNSQETEIGDRAENSDWNPDNWYWVRFHINNDPIDPEAVQLKAKVWKDNEQEPLAWSINAVDTDGSQTIREGGWIGLGGYNNLVDLRYDWFSVGLDGDSALTLP